MSAAVPSSPPPLPPPPPRAESLSYTSVNTTPASTLAASADQSGLPHTLVRLLLTRDARWGLLDRLEERPAGQERPQSLQQQRPQPQQRAVPDSPASSFLPLLSPRLSDASTVDDDGDDRGEENARANTQNREQPAGGSGLFGISKQATPRRIGSDRNLAAGGTAVAAVEDEFVVLPPPALLEEENAVAAAAEGASSRDQQAPASVFASPLLAGTQSQPSYDMGGSSGVAADGSGRLWWTRYIAVVDVDGAAVHLFAGGGAPPPLPACVPASSLAGLGMGSSVKFFEDAGVVEVSGREGAWTLRAADAETDTAGDAATAHGGWWGVLLRYLEGDAEDSGGDGDDDDDDGSTSGRVFGGTHRRRLAVAVPGWGQRVAGGGGGGEVKSSRVRGGVAGWLGALMECVMAGRAQERRSALERANRRLHIGGGGQAAAPSRGRAGDNGGGGSSSNGSAGASRRPAGMTDIFRSRSLDARSHGRGPRSSSVGASRPRRREASPGAAKTPVAVGRDNGAPITVAAAAAAASSTAGAESLQLLSPSPARWSGTVVGAPSPEDASGSLGRGG